MLHIFISSNEENMKPGATGLAITGYEAKIIDSKMETNYQEMKLED
jgi:2-aminobenzoate-CoA ligase